MSRARPSDRDWLRLARKDIGDAARDRVLYWDVGLLGLLGLAGGWGHAQTAAAGASGGLAGTIVLLAIFAVPTVGVVTAHEQVSGERRSGRIRTTLALPYTRRDVVLGAFLGRSTLGVLNVVALVGGGVVGALLFGAPVAPVQTLGFLAGTAVLGVVFAGIAVGWSAATASTTVSLVGSLSTYGLAVFWPTILTTGWRALLTGPVPGWVDRVGAADPLRAYLDLVSASASGFVPAADGGRVAVAAVLLVLWTAVPLALGYRRLARADL